ncbi:TPA: peptidoglycan DD-metalloendopeptidase family protein, partial [Burkholderia multivorans]|nr:peptidoglycan DD-metalloendopeptidase family protein [Burkholderia multivorans]
AAAGAPATAPLAGGAVATAPLSSGPATPSASAPSAVTPPPSASSDTTAAPSGPIVFAWPVRGPVLNGFDDTKNKGVNIGGTAGEAVKAAADGRVVYAGNGLRGYGNLIIIKHDATYLTAYAHNRALMVKEGDAVTKGQKIAEMGNSDADRVMLHFEVRRQGKPVDPMKYLPPQ